MTQSMATVGVGATLGRWVRDVPPLLRILLTLTAATTGLWVSEHSLLYARLGFPNEVGHSPFQLLTQPVLMLLLAAALSAWIMLRRSSESRQRPLERLLHGALIAILVYSWVLAPAQASQAEAAFRAGKPVNSPALAPLSLHAPLAEAEWRVDVPSNTWTVGDGAVLYVGWVGGAIWFWDANGAHAAAVPATQISIVRMKPSGANLARPDAPTTTAATP